MSSEDLAPAQRRSQVDSHRPDYERETTKNCLPDIAVDNRKTFRHLADVGDLSRHSVNE